MLRKKAEDIEGVSSSSFVDLKAVLYKREQDLKRYVPSDKNFTKRVKKRRRTKEQEDNLFYNPSKRNKGIENRLQRDKEYLEEQLEPSSEKLMLKLKEKANQYNKLLYTDHSNDEGIVSDSLVDFERKQWDMDDNAGYKSNEEDESLENLTFLSKYTNDDENEIHGIQYSKDTFNKYIPGGKDYEIARKSRVNAILKLSEETSENRQKKRDIKQQKLLEKKKRLQLIRDKAKETKTIKDNQSTE